MKRRNMALPGVGPAGKGWRWGRGKGQGGGGRAAGSLSARDFFCAGSATRLRFFKSFRRPGLFYYVKVVESAVRARGLGRAMRRMG